MMNTWVDHELPVLDAVVRCLYEDADAMPDVAQIASMTGRDPVAVHRSLRAMEDRFIRIPDASRGADPET
jgi:predicted transcriptional regulator